MTLQEALIVAGGKQSENTSKNSSIKRFHGSVWLERHQQEHA